MLKLKRAYDALEEDDGLRVLVDRLWPRGLRKSSASIHLWMKEIAPSDELRHWFGHEAEKWPEFRRRYWKELDGKKELVEKLAQAIYEGPVTLLFAAHDAEHNNAVALKDYLQRG
jgi:uncharacterized protein YeaO (DUF488 family)